MISSLPFPIPTAYMRDLPAAAHPHLTLLLDWDNGVDKDLIKISENMLRWDESLSVHLGLTEVDIHDIKIIHHDKPSLQR